MTAMQSAFIAALMRWAARGNRSGKISIPSGTVDSAELTRVIIALKVAGTVRAFPNKFQNRQRASR